MAKVLQTVEEKIDSWNIKMVCDFCLTDHLIYSIDVEQTFENKNKFAGEITSKWVCPRCNTVLSLVVKDYDIGYFSSLFKYKQALKNIETKNGPYR